MIAGWQDIQRARKIRESLKLNRWRRLDVEASRFRKTAPDGPQWPYVVRRVVKDAHTQEILDDHFVEDVEAGDHEAIIPGGPKDTVTEFVLQGWWHEPSQRIQDGGPSRRRRCICL